MDFMGELIWVGNTLLPRWFVWGVAALMAIIVALAVAAFVERLRLNRTD